MEVPDTLFIEITKEEGEVFSEVRFCYKLYFFLKSSMFYLQIREILME
jgi:hypothetical protein